MATKTKSGLFQTPVKKRSPTSTPRSKLGSSASVKSDTDSVSRNPRLSIDGASTKSVTSRPVSQSSSRVSTSDKPQPRINKPSELQAQLQAAQDDLKKAKEKLNLSEKEKIQALNDLQEAKKLADEANAKLQQAVVAQKRAEESSEIENFRAVELEQAGIEAAQEKEEEWKKEVESLLSQLNSSKEELQEVKLELAMVIDTKNQAIAHADDATKVAEIHAEKVDSLSSELLRLKGLLESKSKDETFENGTVVELRQELEMAKSIEKELIEKEKSYEKKLVDLKLELESLREEFDKLNACKQELVEKEKSYEKIVAEMTADLENAKICEQGLVEKQKSFEKTIEELKSSSDSLQHDLEKSKASEQYLLDREKSHDVIVTELKSEIDFVKQELEKAKGLERKVMELESENFLLNQELEKADSMVEEKIEREKSNEKTVRDLQQELQVAKSFQEKLTQMEDSHEQMNVQLEAARMAESYALNSLDEWKRRAEELESQVAETARLERSASISLESIMKQLDGNSDILHEAECEVSALKEKVSLLEISLFNKKKDMEESECRVRKANEEVKEAAKVIESLKSELEAMKEEKAQALENERLAASSVQDLLEEKNNIINELVMLKEEEEKSKMAMESLTSALHEVSSEAREAKERLLYSQTEHEHLETQIEHLQMVVKATSEKYEAILDDSRREIDHLTNALEQSKIEFDTQMEDMKVVLKASNDKYESMLDEAKQEINHLTDTLTKSNLDHENKKVEWESSYEGSKVEWEQKEVELVNGLKRSEEEKSSMEKEITRLVHLLGETEEKALNVQDSLKEALEEAKADCLKLKETLHGKEKELENIMRENEQLRDAEDSNAWKIDELTKLLEEAKTHHQNNTENGELSDSDKDYDLLPKVVGFSVENGHLGEPKPGRESFQTGVFYPVEVDGKPTTPENKEQAKEETGETEGKMWESYQVDKPGRESFQTGVFYPVEVDGKPMTPENKEQAKEEMGETDGKMWESYQVDREFSTEMDTEQGSLDDEDEFKAENGESVDHNGNLSENGSNVDPKQQKKKKPLYRKFGNLFKANGNPK